MLFCVSCECCFYVNCRAHSGAVRATGASLETRPWAATIPLECVWMELCVTITPSASDTTATIPSRAGWDVRMKKIIDFLQAHLRARFCLCSQTVSGLFFNQIYSSESWAFFCPAPDRKMEFSYSWGRSARGCYFFCSSKLARAYFLQQIEIAIF